MSTVSAVITAVSCLAAVVCLVRRDEETLTSAPRSALASSAWPITIAAVAVALIRMVIIY
ncbi:MAG: hypothetical protein IPG97_10675 [Microthrixaceae bacterium]|jgi:hypothetical protein|nr:hypothetical protein [Microthrixaceae bacterium]